MKQTLSVATGGLAPPKGITHVIYSHTPLLLGTNRHKAKLFCTGKSR